MQQLNTLARPADDRHFSISQAFVDIAYLGITRKGEFTSPEEDDFTHLYAATHTEGPMIDERLAGLLELLEIQVPPDIHPGRRAYFERSPSQREAGLEIIRQLEEAQAQEKRLNSSEEDVSDAALSAISQKIDSLNTQLDAAFERVTDVDPTQVPELLKTVNVKMLYGTHVMGPYASFSSSLISMISAGLGIDPATGIQKDLQIPMISEEGRLIMLPVSVEDASAILQPERLNPLMNSLFKNRYVLAECAGMLKLFWQPGSQQFNSTSRSFDGCLKPLPFLNELASRRPAGTEQELMRLMTQPSRGLPQGNGDYGVQYPYEDPNSGFHQFDFAVRTYMAADDELAGQYEKMFAQCASFSGSGVRKLKQLREARERSDFKSAAELIESMIEPPPDTKLDLGIAQPAVLIALSQICEDPLTAQRLKNRIRNIGDVRSMLSPMRDLDATMSLEALLPDIVKRLSITLDDFYGNEEFVARIRTAMGEFIRASEHPELLDGITPDKILRNSAFIWGAPGAGKTFFVECLANEFGLKLFEIATETAEGDKSYAGKNKQIMSVEDKIRVLDQEFDKVEKYAESRPCIVFIDEFEEYGADRRNNRTTADQAKLTTFTSRKIIDIRQKHPNIFLVSASNFSPGEIDEAVLRDGRFDIIIELEIPTREDIAKMIGGTLAVEAPGLGLTDEQIVQVSDKAFGLMPFSIIKTTIATCRIGTEGGELTFEDLLAAIEQTKLDRAIDIERNMSRREGKGAK